VLSGRSGRNAYMRKLNTPKDIVSSRSRDLRATEAQACTCSMLRGPAPSEADIRCGWQHVRFVPKADIRQRGVLTNRRGGQADIDWSLLHVERTHTMRAKLFLDGWSLQ